MADKMMKFPTTDTTLRGTPKETLADDHHNDGANSQAQTEQRETVTMARALVNMPSSLPRNHGALPHWVAAGVPLRHTNNDGGVDLEAILKVCAQHDGLDIIEKIVHSMQKMDKGIDRVRKQHAFIRQQLELNSRLDEKLKAETATICEETARLHAAFHDEIAACDAATVHRRREMALLRQDISDHVANVRAEDAEMSERIANVETRFANLSRQDEYLMRWAQAGVRQLPQGSAASE